MALEALGLPAGLLAFDSEEASPVSPSVVSQLTRLGAIEPLKFVKYQHEAEKVERSVAYEVTKEHVKGKAREAWMRYMDSDKPVAFNKAPSASELSSNLADTISSTTTSEVDDCLNVLMFGTKPSELKTAVMGVESHIGFVDADDKPVGRVEKHPEFQKADVVASERRKKAQEIRENTRKKGIKSRKYRQLQRKQRKIDEERALAELQVTNPEVADRIAEEYETKRAEMRLMRRQKNRSKWAKMAKRFGGSDIQKSISEQKQLEWEDRRLLEELAKKRVVDCLNADVGDSQSSNDEEASSSDESLVVGKLTELEELEELDSEDEELKLHEKYISEIRALVAAQGVSPPSGKESTNRTRKATREKRKRKEQPQASHPEGDIESTYSKFRHIEMRNTSNDDMKEVFEIMDEPAASLATITSGKEEVTPSKRGWTSWAGEDDDCPSNSPPDYSSTIDKPFSRTIRRHTISEKIRDNLKKKYFIEEKEGVPFPFANKDQYNSSLSDTRSQGSVTIQQFYKLNKPKISIRPGTTIQPFSQGTINN